MSTSPTLLPRRLSTSPARRCLAAFLRALLLLVVATSMASAVGCSSTRKHQKQATQQVVGVWADEGDVKYTFVQQGSLLTLTEVLDTDGERFEVVESGWEEDTYRFVYKVPSTGYVVTTWIETFGALSLKTRWSNVTPDGGSNSGTETFRRVQ